MPRTKSTKAAPRKEIIGDELDNKTVIDAIYRKDHIPSCSFVVKEPDKPPYIWEDDKPYIARGEEVYPPERMKDLFRRKIISLPSDIVEPSSTGELLRDLVALLGKYIDLGSFELQFIAHYCLLTWVWQRFASFGLLGFQGVPGSGKSTSLAVLKRLTYRGTDAGVNISKANLVRMSNQIGGTLLIDEVDRADDDFRAGFVQVLNQSYKRDGVVPLLEQTGDVWGSVMMSVGGPRIVAHRADFNDRALMSRFFTIPMVVKKTSVPSHLPDEFEAEAAAMRNRLLAWRLENRYTIKPDSSELRDLTPRAREIGVSIFSLSPDEGFRKTFLDWLKNRDAEMASDDPVRVILEAIANECRPTASKPSFLSIKEIQAQALSIAVERGVPAWEISNKRIASACRSLRFNTKPARNGTEIEITFDVLSEQLKHHNL